MTILQKKAFYLTLVLIFAFALFAAAPLNTALKADCGMGANALAAENFNYGISGGGYGCLNMRVSAFNALRPDIFIYISALLLLAAAAAAAALIFKKKKKTYTIKFITNSRIKIKPLRLERNEPIFLPVPEQKGMYFGGWYKDKNLSSKFGYRAMPQYNLKAYAKWDKDTGGACLGINSPQKTAYNNIRKNYKKAVSGGDYTGVIKTADGSLFKADKKRTKRVPFAVKIKRTNPLNKQNYQTLKNEFLSYNNIKPRFSVPCESFRSGRRLVAKITLTKTLLRLHLNLNTEDYEKNKYFFRDFGNKKAYKDVPFTVKIKSPRSVKKAKILISEAVKNIL